MTTPFLDLAGLAPSGVESIVSLNDSIIFHDDLATHDEPTDDDNAMLHFDDSDDSDDSDDDSDDDDDNDDENENENDNENHEEQSFCDDESEPDGNKSVSEKKFFVVSSLCLLLCVN
jgi:hypothetical protein